MMMLNEDRRMISIILVSYNNLNQVVKTLDSLKFLKNPQHEIIIVDSSNNTEIFDYINSLRSVKIKYITQTKQGIYAAMNLGIFNATDNSYIWFLNPGDILVNASVIDQLITSLVRGGYQWGFAQAKSSDHTSKEIYPSKVHSINAKNFANGKLKVSHQACFATKEILMTNGCFDSRYQIAADHEMFLKLSRNKGYYFPFLIVEIDPNGLSSKKAIRTIFEAVVINYRMNIWSLAYALYIFMYKLWVLLIGTLLIYVASIVKKVISYGK
jgi:glycosyltransferase involved in cell wall biosynthesis